MLDCIAGPNGAAFAWRCPSILRASVSTCHEDRIGRVYDRWRRRSHAGLDRFRALAWDDAGGLGCFYSRRLIDSSARLDCDEGNGATNETNNLGYRMHS